jgi:hypothetical protein
VASLCGAQDRQQIPHTVYVGDRAMLVVLLPEHGVAGTIEIDPALYSSDDIELHRIALEKRPAGSRLVIEFTGFAPGRFELPPFEAGGMRFSGLYLTISSIITGKEPPVLSGLTSPLSVPGTGFLVYGTMAALIVLIIAVLWTAVWGRHYFRRRFSVRKNLRLISLMARFEKRMEKALASGKSSGFVLDAVSSEFRVFLSLLTGVNCRAMTPAEFERLPNGISFDVPSDDVLSGAVQQCPQGWPAGFLKRFFGNCDELRFTGVEADNSEVYTLLGELHKFLSGLYRTVREYGMQKRRAV